MAMYHIENLWADLTWEFFEWNGLFGCAPGCWEYICTGTGMGACLPACLLGYLRFFWVKDLVCMVGGDGLTEGGNPYVAYFVLYRRGVWRFWEYAPKGRVSGVLGVFFLHLSLRIGIWEFCFFVVMECCACWCNYWGVSYIPGCVGCVGT